MVFLLRSLCPWLLEIWFPGWHPQKGWRCWGPGPMQQVLAAGRGPGSAQPHSPRGVPTPTTDPPQALGPRRWLRYRPRTCHARSSPRSDTLHLWKRRKTAIEVGLNRTAGPSKVSTRAKQLKHSSTWGHAHHLCLHFCSLPTPRVLVFQGFPFPPTQRVHALELDFSLGSCSPSLPTYSP